MWLMVLIIYAAPANAVDWDGPWAFGMTHVADRHYVSEAECRNSAIEAIGRIHQGMLAPIRYRCVQVDAELPKGAPR